MRNSCTTLAVIWWIENHKFSGFCSSPECFHHSDVNTSDSNPTSHSRYLPTRANIEVKVIPTSAKVVITVVKQQRYDS